MVSQLDFYSWKLRDGRLLQGGFPMEILTKIRYLIIFDYHIFRSRAFMRKGSLGVTFFPSVYLSVCPQILGISFFGKL